jgi:hypothetical protein
VRNARALERAKDVNDERRVTDWQQRTRAQALERRASPRIAAGENDGSRGVQTVGI